MDRKLIWTEKASGDIEAIASARCNALTNHVAKPMAGRHDADFSFNQLCSLLIEVGYAMRKAKGSHVLFHRDASFLNLQSAPGGKAKPYQVRLVRQELPNLNLKP
jgi:hypothetical protein